MYGLGDLLTLRPVPHETTELNPNVKVSLQVLDYPPFVSPSVLFFTCELAMPPVVTK